MWNETSRRMGPPYAAFVVIIECGMLLMVPLGGMFFLKGSLTASAFLLFLYVGSLYLTEIRPLQELGTNFANVLGAVTKAKEILDIPGYDSYISYAAAKPLSVFQYLDAPNVYLTPNMTYKPRMMKKPPHCVVNGSLAILIPKGGIVPTEKQLAYFSSEEYRAFYQIARNFQTRSLNVDACSVFFYGLLRDEARPAPEKFDTSVQLSFL